MSGDGRWSVPQSSVYGDDWHRSARAKQLSPPAFAWYGGILYGALAVAAASGSALRGAVAMLAFGLGTVPSLVAVGVAGQAFGRAWQRAVSTVSPIVLVLNAIVLATLALLRLTA